MRIFRGALTTTKWDQTDEIKPQDYIDNWVRSREIVFDGTIKKNPSHESKIKVRIGDDDVVALFEAYLRRMQKNEKKFLTQRKTR